MRKILKQFFFNNHFIAYNWRRVCSLLPKIMNTPSLSKKYKYYTNRLEIVVSRGEYSLKLPKAPLAYAKKEPNMGNKPPVIKEVAIVKGENMPFFSIAI